MAYPLLLLNESERAPGPLPPSESWLRWKPALDMVEFHDFGPRWMPCWKLSKRPMVETVEVQRWTVEAPALFPALRHGGSTMDSTV